MPLYEFRCLNGHDFEKFYRSIGAAQAEEKCPECGAAAARLISAAGLVFKGSGFYITDYGKDGKKAEREAATAKDKSKTEAASTETKSPDSTVKTESAPAKAADTPKAATETKPSTKPAPESKTTKKPSTGKSG